MLEDFFISLYGLVHKLYAKAIDAYMLGGSSYVDGELVYGGTVRYVSLGVTTLCAALLVFLLYYYVVNSAALNKWWHWVLVVCIVGVVGLFIGYNSIHDGEIPEALLKNETGTMDVLNFFDYFGLGIANGIIAVFFFIILTLAGKWGSTNCRRTPF